MTDDLSRYGLGALPDPPDERDDPVSALDASHIERRPAALARTSRGQTADGTIRAAQGDG